MTTSAGSPSDPPPGSGTGPGRAGAHTQDGTPHLGLVAADADYGAFYTREYRAIVALAWSLTGSRASAEELAQDAFVDAYRSWERLARYDRPGAWVRRAVTNRAVSRRRRARTEDAGLRRLVVEQGASRPVESASDQPLGDETFWTEVRALPDRQAQCVALHYLEDRSVADIAVVLGCSESTVKVHLHRGRVTLAHRLDEPIGQSGADQ